MPRNELPRVLDLLAAWKSEGGSRSAFARRHRLHPSAFSRLQRVDALPPEVLSELAALPALSRTHLEVIATAPPERRTALIEGARAGRSTYAIRERRETTCVRLGASAAPEARGTPGPLADTPGPTSPTPGPGDERLLAVAAALGASPDEAAAFAAELLAVLWRSNRERVLGSFEAFQATRGLRAQAS